MRSDEEETAQTVTYMDDLVAADANDPAVLDATAEALEQAGIDGNASDVAKARAVYWWLKRTIRYVPTPGTSPLVDQTLIAPTALLAMPEPIGDCPQFSMLAAAMFRVLCMDCLYVTIAAERRFPDQYSHVYNTVEVAPGRYMPFDSSNGPEPGAEYMRPFKRRVWPRLTVDRHGCKEGKHMLRGTHRNVPTGMRNATTRRALRRMGDVSCDEDGNCYDSGTGDYTPAPIDLPVYSGGANPSGSALQLQTQPTSTPTFLGPSPTPTSSGPSSNALLSSLLSDATQLATPAIRAATQQAPYYITNPATGQSALYNPNTGTFAGATTALGTMSPTTLVIGAVVIGALIFMGGKK
jgi:hypothetical protein